MAHSDIKPLTEVDLYEGTWEIVERMMKAHEPRALIGHLIESFNDFILVKLEDIVEGFNPIELNNQYLEEENAFRYVLTIQMKNPSISKPMIHEKDGSTKVMTPEDARSRNFTYSAPLYVDMHITAKTYNLESKEYATETKTLNRVLLGKIPIMVGSKYCILSSNSFETKECRYDPGGYFIVNGTEKAVISQDRIAENKTYVFTNNKVSSYSHVAEIRSVEDNRFSVPKTATLKLSSKSNQFGRYVRVTIHHVKHDIPIFILFRALGLESDADIVRHIVYDLEDPLAARITSELVGSVEEGSSVLTEHDAKEYLLRFMNLNGYPREFTQDKFYRLQILQRILETEFLPHVGRNLRQKALYLGYMFRKLLKCYIGGLPFDDRDSYLNKHVDTPGVLMANLYRQYYGKMIKDMKNMLQKDINAGAWKATNKFINVINKGNINKIVKSTIIDAGLKYGLATGNWGIKTNRTKQGVAQVLNRMSYNATLSHLRRINTPIEKTGKLVQPRKLHSTQWGIICPAETPEGASVGLVKNMAFLCHITISSQSQNIYEILRAYDGMQLYEKAHASSDLGCYARHTCVFVNGNLVGAVEDAQGLVHRLKTLKRTGAMNAMTSIVWNTKQLHILVCTDAGRCVRPLYIVEDGRIRLDARILALLRSHQIGWNELVIGSVYHDVPPVIEYLDVEEVNQAMIAMRVEDLEKHAMVSYTHVEMDPSLILGVLAGSIPFSNHNQAPRNSYQSAMGKQAIGIYASNYLQRYDTMGHILNYPQRPLVQTRIGKLVHGNDLPCGVNVVVAIATYTGFNQEDSIIMNRSAVDRGMFQSTYYRTYKEQNNKNHSTGEEEYFCKPTARESNVSKPHNYEKLEERGFVPENTAVESGDVIIGKCMPQKNSHLVNLKDTSVFLKNNERGVVDRNASLNTYFTNVNGDGYTFCKVRIRSDRIPTIGDKFCLPHWAEALTRTGWKPIFEVTASDWVAQYNPATRAVEYVQPTATMSFYHDGDMYEACGENVYALVTPEHKMAIQRQRPDGAWDQEVELVQAKDLGAEDPAHWRVLKRAEAGYTSPHGNRPVVFGEVGETETVSMKLDDWLVVYASWLRHSTDDFFECKMTVHPKAGWGDRVNEVLEAAGIGSNHEIRHPRVYEHLKKLYSSADMAIWAYEHLTRDQSRQLLEALLDDDHADGSLRRRCIPTLADGLQQVALHAGWSADVCTIPDSRQMQLIVHRSAGKAEKEGGVETYGRKPYRGRVFCLEVPTHMFYVRMHGKTMWTGNSSRHGQKGTVGMLYRQEDMPFTKDGIVPDIIINSHCIPSRMTIAQLMECIMGKACALTGTYGDATPFTRLQVEDLASILEANGVERYGNEVLYNSRTGEQMPCSIFMGPTYYQRLKHMTDDKIHSRSQNGPVVLLTRQPAEGRARDGGLRLGEMEVECNWAHGCLAFLKERFSECSDHYRVFVCKKCGMIADVNPDKNIYNCRSCKNATQFSEIRIPYAAKLLFQEVQTMSIATKFIT